MVEVLYKGRKRKVHSGSRGGKYVVVQGTKRYLKVRKSASKKKPAKKTTKKCVGCKNMKCVCIPRKKKVVKRKPQKKKKPAKRKTMKGGASRSISYMPYYTLETSDTFDKLKCNECDATIELRDGNGTCKLLQKEPGKVWGNLQRGMIRHDDLLTNYETHRAISSAGTNTSKAINSVEGKTILEGLMRRMIHNTLKDGARCSQATEIDNERRNATVRAVTTAARRERGGQPLITGSRIQFTHPDAVQNFRTHVKMASSARRHQTPPNVVSRPTRETLRQGYNKYNEI